MIAKAHIKNRCGTECMGIANHGVRERVPNGVVHCRLRSGLNVMRVVYVEAASQRVVVSDSLVDPNHPLISVQNIRAGVDVVVPIDVGVGGWQENLSMILPANGVRVVTPLTVVVLAGSKIWGAGLP
jgi:hypothetical protein